MGTLADSLFNVLMSWARALVSAIWALFSSERTTILEFLARNWLGIVIVIIAAGLAIDWLIWLIRWQPYHIWAMRVRRLLHIRTPEEIEAEQYDRLAAYEAQHEAYMPPQTQESDAHEDHWMPLEQPMIDEEEAQQVMDAAEQVPDETLGQYPGMRYDSRAGAQADMSGTRRFGAVHAEGPGAAEVNRRRAEIDAWQKQMQEEARQKAQAERAARQAEAERRRIEEEARAAYEAEQARLAREAQEAEQARRAQAEYELQLAEYERQKAQYEWELAEYERQKAAYDAAIAAQNAAAGQTEFAEENPQPAAGAHRRRRAVTYSDYVEGEDVSELPAPPEWTQMQPQSLTQGMESEASKPQKKGLFRGGMSKMAHMIEPEHEDVTGITALPPRVDMHAAYKPAKRPTRSGQ